MLAVVAALIGLAFKTVVYKMEDLWDMAWKNRPEWARPAVGGIALGLVLLALPQMYGVGYPVMYKAVAGDYVLWFLLVLAAGKILACSLTLGIGGSGGVFAPSLFIGVTSGMAFGEIADHAARPGRRPAGPVRGRGHGRGVRLRGPGPADLAGQRGGDDRRLHPHPAGDAGRRDRHRHLAGAELRHHLHHQAAAPRAGHRPRRALAGVRRPEGRRRDAPVPRAARRHAGPDARRPRQPRPRPGAAAGPVTYQGDPQAVFASESLAQALRQLEVYGRDGLPVLSADGQQVQGWITSASVLHAVAREIGGSPPPGPPPGRRGPARRGTLPPEPPTPLPGYQVLEVTVEDGSPASGQALGAIAWPPGCFPVSVLRNRRLQRRRPRPHPGPRRPHQPARPRVTAPSVPRPRRDEPDSEADGQRARHPAPGETSGGHHRGADRPGQAPVIRRIRAEQRPMRAGIRRRVGPRSAEAGHTRRR